MTSTSKQLIYFGGASLDCAEKENRIFLQEVSTYVRIDKILQSKRLESLSTLQRNTNFAKRHFACWCLYLFLLACGRPVRPHTVANTGGGRKKKASVSWLCCVLFVIRWSWGENGRLNLHIVTRKNKGESGNEPGARSLSNICPPARPNIYPTYLGKISPPLFLFLFLPACILILTLSPHLFYNWRIHVMTTKMTN